MASNNINLQISDETMEKLHQTTQEILDVFVDICEKNDLRYYLTAGTLLGAVRHEGPIPWDDDLDVCMPREDFERFKQIMLARPEGETFHIHCFENDRNSPKTFARLKKRGTVLVIQYFIDTGSKYNEVWIDIFPLDDSPDPSDPQFLKRGKVITKMKALSAIRVLKTTQGMRWTGKCFHALLKLIPITLIFGMSEHLMKSENKKGFKYYVSWGCRYGFKKQTMPKEWYGTPVKVLYSKKYYDAPQEWDKVLTQLYGDYMKLPPESERVGHDVMEIDI